MPDCPRCGEALRERDELRIQLDAWYSIFGTSQLTHAKDNLDTKIQSIRKLEAALKQYGQHRWKCAKLAALVEVGAKGDHEGARVKAAGLPCTCGFATALSGTPDG